MNKNIIIAMLASAAGVLAGCDKQPSTSESGYDTNTVAGSNSVSGSAAMSASNAWQNTKEGSSNAWQSTKEGASNLWQKTKSTLGSMGETNGVSTNYFGFDYTQKDAFVSQAKAGLDDLESRLSNLSGQADNASGTAKTDLEQKLQEAKSRQSDASAKYDAVKSATQDSWNDAKAAFIKSYYDLKATVKGAEDAAKTNM